MDVNRLINLVTRMLFRSAVRKGVSLAARKGKPQAQMTPEERKQAQSAKAMASRAQRAIRFGGRFLR